MKCPKCEVKHPYKQGMKCVCGYHFLLDPKRDGMADRKFTMAVDAASQGDTHYFTANQLYSVLAKRKNFSPRIPFLAMMIFACGFVAALALMRPINIGVLMFFLVVSGISAVVWQLVKSRPTFSRKKFDQILRTWLTSGRKLEKLVQSPTMTDPPPDWQEPDIYNYGVESVLIVERDELVNLFVLNGFHTKERALVIAESGYPQYLLPTAVRLIQERSDLPVYLLHDSTGQGVAMRQRVEAGGTFPVWPEQIVDMGIFPKDVERTKRFGVFRPATQAHQLPLDYLPYAGLALGLGAAVAGHSTLADVLDAAQDPRGKAGTDAYGSFG